LFVVDCGNDQLWRSTMSVLRLGFITLLGGICMVTTSTAQELIVFPNADQDKQQQEQDEFACYSWAKGETGFDPMAVPTATEPPPQESTYKQGGVMRGAVRGAAVGGIVGDSDDAKSCRGRHATPRSKT
jgi:hypothetical protein